MVVNEWMRWFRMDGDEVCVWCRLALRGSHSADHNVNRERERELGASIVTGHYKNKITKWIHYTLLIPYALLLFIYIFYSIFSTTNAFLSWLLFVFLLLFFFVIPDLVWWRPIEAASTPSGVLRRTIERQKNKFLPFSVLCYAHFWLKERMEDKNIYIYEAKTKIPSSRTMDGWMQVAA